MGWKFPFHAPLVPRDTSQKYSFAGKILKSRSGQASPPGNATIKCPLSIPASKAVPAASTFIKNGIGKSFLSVNGVLTKPGRMRESPMPARSRSNLSDCDIAIKPAFVVL